MTLVRSLDRNRRPCVFAVVTACAAGLLVALALATTPCGAASIPSWLDDGISKWNATHPETQIRFVSIKDSFVWYDLKKTPELGQQEIRERVNSVVLGRGYVVTDDEELITMGRPPATEGPVTPKKCWSRSFVLDIAAQSNTKAVGAESSGQRQRMLTRLVCEDTATWWAAFRVLD